MAGYNVRPTSQSDKVYASQTQLNITQAYLDTWMPTVARLEDSKGGFCLLDSNTICLRLHVERDEAIPTRAGGYVAHQKMRMMTLWATVHSYRESWNHQTMLSVVCCSNN